MKALIVYSSWFGHNRTVARLLAADLARRGFGVAGAPASKIGAANIAGYDVLVLGTHAHAGRASARLLALCESIPLRAFDRLTVALFSAERATRESRRATGGAHILEHCLAERGIELDLAPLRIDLRGPAAFVPWLGIGAAQRKQIEDFADELWEASVPDLVF